MARRGENIRKRNDGRWEGRYVVRVDGRGQYRSVYAKTYLEVKEKLLAAKVNAAEGRRQRRPHSPTSCLIRLHRNGLGR